MRGSKPATLSQVQSTWGYAPPEGGELINRTAIRIMRTAAAPIDPTPAAAAALREKRGPSVASSRALAKGTARTSQSNSSTLSPHLARGIGVQGFESMIKLQDQGQPHGDLRRRHGQNEKKDYLAVGLMPARAGDYKSQTGGVQHDLE